MDVLSPESEAAAAQLGEPFLLAQMRILEMVATRAPLIETLSELTRCVEAQDNGLCCTILIVSDDGRRFHGSSGPNLPESYHRAFGQAPIRPPYLSPCCQVAHQGAAIIVPEIANDDRWSDAWRDLVLSRGLVACHSTPVLGPDGRVRACFSMFYDQTRDADRSHLQLTEVATRLAGMAIAGERPQADVREEERQTRELLASLPIAVYTTDADGRITFYNAAAADLWGHRPELGRSEWCGSWRLFHPDGRPMAHDECPMAVALKNGRAIIGGEAAAERPDGTRVPFLAYPVPLRDASGALLGAVNTLVDITRQKQAAEALQQSEVRLATELAAAQRLQELSTLMIREGSVETLYHRLIDAASALMQSDAASMQMLDPERGELRLLAWKGFHPDSARFWEWVRIDSASTCGAGLRRGERIVVPDVDACDSMAGTADLDAYRRSEIRAVQSTPLVSRSGQLLGMISTHWHSPRRLADCDLRLLDVLARQAADLIERAMGDAALRASEQQFRAIFDSAAVGVAVLTPAAQFLQANSAFCCITGYSADELQAMDCGALTHPDDRAPMQRRLDELLAGRMPSFVLEKRYIRKDGVVIWVQNSISLTRDGRGQPLHLIALCQDITERRKADQRLRELNDTLEQRVHERTHELEQATEERRKIEAALQHAQRLEALGRLTGGVAHDFNNLLTVVLGQTENLVKAAGDNHRMIRMATAAQRAAERGAQLTGQLLAFARHQRLRPEAVKVDRLIANVSDLLRRAVGEAVCVAVEADADLWSSQVDPAQFESALLNLAINARDAMPNGGRLRIEARNTLISSIEARRLDLTPGHYVVVGVTDTGGGMSPEVRSRCFEPFFTTKDVGRGTGLGLAQIYGFARQSGGTAAIDSAVGRGTTVLLYLPQADGLSGGEQPRTIAAAAVDGQGKTILVVDDQADVRDVVETWLSGQGYRIITAADGAEARTVLESSQPVDLLLTDIVMPNGISGIELARAARRLRQGIKVVVVSGFSPDTQPRARNQDEFVFLEKPFRQAELADAIGALLGNETDSRAGEAVGITALSDNAAGSPHLPTRSTQASSPSE